MKLDIEKVVFWFCGILMVRRKKEKHRQKQKGDTKI